MAATVLEIPVDKVYISETSTVTVPNAVETGGSFVADLNGRAVMVSLTTFVLVVFKVKMLRKLS